MENISDIIWAYSNLNHAILQQTFLLYDSRSNYIRINERVYILEQYIWDILAKNLKKTQPFLATISLTPVGHYQLKLNVWLVGYSPPQLTLKL